MGRRYSHIIMCELQSTEFWWDYHTNLSIKASLPKLALRPYLAPPGLPVTNGQCVGSMGIRPMDQQRNS